MSNYTCFRKQFTVKRKQGGSYVDGQWVPGNDVDIIIKASLQPMSPEEMDKLPEGRRTNETFKLYTKTRLYTVTDENPDYLLIDGIGYEVVSVGKYQSDVINHYKVFIQRKADDR
jgi:predicted nucleotidyltransferase